MLLLVGLGASLRLRGPGERQPKDERGCLCRGEILEEWFLDHKEIEEVRGCKEKNKGAKDGSENTEGHTTHTRVRGVVCGLGKKRTTTDDGRLSSNRGLVGG